MILLCARYKEYLESASRPPTGGPKQDARTSMEASCLIADTNRTFGEISAMLPADRVSLIFQEAFNDIAAGLEMRTQGFVAAGEARAKQYGGVKIVCRVMRDLGEIDAAIGQINIPEHSKGIRKRIRTVIDQLTIKFLPA
ncbi:MAG: hypothetical protein P4M11_14000 [Candidatus Pacebacteria bacterium]|nr:hypothetical protein [Candidatus Paceibacterota bacterium]